MEYRRSRSRSRSERLEKSRLPGPLWWAFAFVVGVASAAAIAWETRKAADRETEEEMAEEKYGRKYYVLKMQEREYIKFIPEDELKVIKQLIAKINRMRGWKRDDVASMDKALHQVLAGAKTSEGGGWSDDFNDQHMTKDALCKLGALVDRHLLGNCLYKKVEETGRPPLTFKYHKLQMLASYYLRSNSIGISVNMWKDKVISVEQPITCEGVIVYTKLEALVHTIAHEFVHALVAVFFPDTIELSAAYYGKNDASPYHGPTFKLLNRRIFDHNNTSWCTTLAEPHDKYGEPLKAPKKEKREVWDEQGFL